MLALVLISLALLSIGINLWQWFAASRFQIHQGPTHSNFTPPLSILKPLKGADAETEACLESWFQQDYPAESEILFGVLSPEDPVCPIVRRLIAKYPLRTAQLVFSRPVLGPNGKVSTLSHLAKLARHEHLVLCDADVFVRNNFLVNLVSGLRDKSVGLVNCFYILANPANFPMRLEAVAVNADFWAQVLQSLTLKPMDFALGAAMATTKTELARVGGFDAFLELLADDYELGNRLARAGRKLTICPIPVECRSAEQSGRAVWRHQLRWARTIRVCQPAGYFFSILANATIWPLLALWIAPWIFPIAMALRMLTAISNHRRLTGHAEWWVPVLAPLKDVAQAVLWLACYGGNIITWHGQQFRVSRGGKLTPLA